MSLASLTKWKSSMLTVALGSQLRTADRNAALGSIVTTRTRCRHQRGLLFNHVFTAAESRPSTTPMTWPLAWSTNGLFAVARGALAGQRCCRAWWALRRRIRAW